MSQSESNMRVDIEHIVVRPYPKIILLYPIALCALLCGIVQSFYDSDAKGAIHTLGLIFFIVFGVNLLVFSFEFSRLKSLTLGFGILALVFLGLWLGEKIPILSYLREFVASRQFELSTQMYWGIFIYFIVIFLCVLINTRFNYYEIKHNEILHHTGFLGYLKRYPSPNLKMTKEINDVFEFLLLRSGRLMLYPASEREAIVLENVLNINTKEKAIGELLSSLAVEIDSSRHHMSEQGQAPAPENH